MNVLLSPDERRLVVRVLTQYRTDLRAEMAATQSFEYRTTLHREQDNVRGIMAKLDPSAAFHPDTEEIWAQAV